MKYEQDAKDLIKYVDDQDWNKVLSLINEVQEKDLRAQREMSEKLKKRRLRNFQYLYNQMSNMFFGSDFDQFVTIHHNHAFNKAAEYGSLDVVNRLLEIPVIASATKLVLGALHLAVRNGHLAIVDRLMIVSGVCRAAADEAGSEKNLLVIAAKHGQVEVLNRLLEIFPFNLYAGLALDDAVENGHLAVVNRLLEIPDVLAYIEDGMQNYLFAGAVKNGHLAVVNRLLEIPAFLANVTRSDNLFLYLSRAHQYAEITERLLAIPAVRDLDRALSGITPVVLPEFNSNDVNVEKLTTAKNDFERGQKFQSLRDYEKYQSLSDDDKITDPMNLNIIDFSKKITVTLLESGQFSFFQNSEGASDSIDSWFAQGKKTDPMSRSEIMAKQDFNNLDDFKTYLRNLEPTSAPSRTRP